MSHRQQFWALVIGLPLFVFVLLMLAQLGLSVDKRCGWQAIKGLGCLLSRHENLAGGLIGASGALFAGWLAWTAIREQINLEKKSRAQDEARQKQRDLASKIGSVRNAEREVATLEQTRAYIEDILAEFEGAPFHEYASRLQDRYRKGGLPLQGGGEVHIELNAIMQAMQKMGAELSSASADASVQIRVTLNYEIKRRVEMLQGSMAKVDDLLKKGKINLDTLRAEARAMGL